MTDIQYTMGWNNDGVSITKWDYDAEPEPVVLDEWWYTWQELFMELTGVEDHSPHIE